MLKNKVILGCNGYENIKIHLELPMHSTLWSNKSNNDKYEQLTARGALVDETSYCKF